MDRSQAPAVHPHVIQPTAVYSATEARDALRLTASTIRREVRKGRLRIAKRAGRYYLLGTWLLEWLMAGEVTRRPVERHEEAGRDAPLGGS